MKRMTPCGHEFPCDKVQCIWGWKPKKTLKKTKVLKIWNGRGVGQKEHLYLAAYSRADACRMLVELYPHTTVGHWTTELKNYFAEDCWGNNMDGIAPERGIWITRDGHATNQVPERIYPKQEGN